ncbi:WSC domain-containing protein [Annulohypoxylon bovei var. microspora]|nr:WSC domain-containing protein [Annulohypoxylon bovei var. microspora]
MAPHTSITVLSLLMLLVSTPFSLGQEVQPPTPTQSDTVPSFTPAPSNNTRQGPNGLRIIDEDTVYKYAGCWSETTEITPHERALDGVYLTVVGQMQVQPCINYCSRSYNRFHPEKKGWKYAGLEYARECWCGDHLSLKSLHLTDTACDTPCDGANSTVCGGHLALTLYNATASSGGKPPGSGGSGGSGGSPGDNDPPKSDAPKNDAVVQAVGVGLLIVALTLAFGLGLL